MKITPALIILYFFFFAALSAQTEVTPRTIDACMPVLQSAMDTSLQSVIRKTSEQKLSELMPEAGPVITSKCGLLSDSPLLKYFNDNGIYTKEEMSFIILSAFQRYLLGQPLDVDDIMESSARSAGNGNADDSRIINNITRPVNFSFGFGTGSTTIQDVGALNTKLAAYEYPQVDAMLMPLFIGFELNRNRFSAGLYYLSRSSTNGDALVNDSVTSFSTQGIHVDASYDITDSRYPLFAYAGFNGFSARLKVSKKVNASILPDDLLLSGNQAEFMFVPNLSSEFGIGIHNRCSNLFHWSARAGYNWHFSKGEWRVNNVSLGKDPALNLGGFVFYMALYLNINELISYSVKEDSDQ